jgi:hypothetical protein
MLFTAVLTVVALTVRPWCGRRRPRSWPAMKVEGGKLVADVGLEESGPR